MKGLISAQEKQLKIQSETIFYLRKEMDCKQKKLTPSNFSGLLQWELRISDKNIFLLQNSKIKSYLQNFDQSKLSAT